MFIMNKYLFLRPIRCDELFAQGLKFISVYFPGQSFYQHPPLADCLLPPVSRNYSADIAGRAFARKVRLVHHDSRYIQVCLLS